MEREATTEDLVENKEVACTLTFFHWAQVTELQQVGGSGDLNQPLQAHPRQLPLGMLIVMPIFLSFSI